MIEIVIIAPPLLKPAHTARISQAENCSGSRWFIGKGPGLPPIIRCCHIDRCVHRQVAAAYDAIPPVAESDTNAACARIADERSIVRVPRIATISRSQDSRRGCATGGDPSVVFPVGSYAGSTCRERSFSGSAKKTVKIRIVRPVWKRRIGGAGRRRGAAGGRAGASRSTPAFLANVYPTAVFNFHGPPHWVMRAALTTFVQGTPFGTSAKVWNCFAEGSG